MAASRAISEFTFESIGRGLPGSANARSYAQSLFAPHLPCDSVALRRVYLGLALMYHPDKWPDADRQTATELFQSITTVYEELSNPGGRVIAKRVKTPTAAAAELGDVQELQRLLEQLPSRASEEDENGIFPVMFAAKGGSIEAAKLLLQFGADLHVQTPLGWSVLLFAALNEQPSMVHWLVHSGVKISENDLVLTAATGNNESLQALLELFGESAATLRTEEKGKTLLHLCCEGMCHLKRDRASKYAACVDLLLQTGVPVDARDTKHGRTCLQSFVGYGMWQEQGFEASNTHLSVVQQLCAWGASPTAVNHDGNSALVLAANLGLRRVEELLLRFVAKPQQMSKL